MPTGPRGEEKFYPGVTEELRELFKAKFGTKVQTLHLEITARGKFSDMLKSKIAPGREIIFSFLRRAPPDITGFIEVKDGYSESGFIVSEVKAGPIKLDHIYQLRKYAELFDAKYTVLFSMVQIPEEIKRLAQAVPSLVHLPYKTFCLCGWDEGQDGFVDWFPAKPFLSVFKL